MGRGKLSDEARQAPPRGRAQEGETPSALLIGINCRHDACSQRLSLGDDLTQLRRLDAYQSGVPQRHLDG